MVIWIDAFISKWQKINKILQMFMNRSSQETGIPRRFLNKGKEQWENQQQIIYLWYLEREKSWFLLPSPLLYILLVRKGKISFMNWLEGKLSYQWCDTTQQTYRILQIAGQRPSGYNINLQKSISFREMVIII